MLLWTRHTYTNTLKERRGNDSGLYHETEESAQLAAMGYEKDYASIAVHSERSERRCDACLQEGKLSGALPRKSGRDLCNDHANGDCVGTQSQCEKRRKGK